MKTKKNERLMKKRELLVKRREKRKELSECIRAIMEMHDLKDHDGLCKKHKEVSAELIEIDKQLKEVS